MRIFDGREEAKKLDFKIKEQLSNATKAPVLGIIQVGNKEESNKYVSLKQRVGEKLGIDVRVYKLAESLSDEEIEKKCEEIFKDNKITKVIVQLPLPRQKLYEILDKIPLEKDVDTLSSEAKQRFYSNGLSFSSPVVSSCEYFLDSINMEIQDKTAIIVGGGELVGKPIEYFLKTKGFKTEIKEDYTRGTKLNADLIILGAGIPNLVDAQDIKEGASVIDFGSSVVSNKTVGDLDMSTNTAHLGTLSPSPGGMGPMVVRMLFLGFTK